MIQPKLRLAYGTDIITIDRKRELLYVPPAAEIRARFRRGLVYLLIGPRLLEMSTSVAVKVGLALAAAGGECSHTNDVVSLDINGEEFNFLPWSAVQVGGVLAKKADRADDWQRATLN